MKIATDWVTCGWMKCCLMYSRKKEKKKIPFFRYRYNIYLLLHQWYWSYEIADTINNDTESSNCNINFDSYMIPTDELEPGDLRLFEVDNKLVLPIDTSIRLVTTGADVIHSFAVPSLGIKIDSIPGRLNQTAITIDREGVYVGSCSELCGNFHFGMPIVIEGVTMDKYLSWLEIER